MRWPSLPWIFWAFSSSLALHGVAYASLSLAPKQAAKSSVASQVTLDVVANVPEAEPAPPPPQEKPQEPEQNQPLPKAAPRAQPTAQPLAKPQATAAPQAAPAPLDLSGVTLTNDSSQSFAMATGNGLAFSGPIGNGRARGAEPAVAPSEPKPAGPPAPSLVPFSDLSSRPAPPALDASLRRNYPTDAKQRAIGGTARVKARIEPDGSIRRADVESESFAGFGEACRRTLLASRWSAPRDRVGRAVATEIRYTCRFVVEP